MIHTTQGMWKIMGGWKHIYYEGFVSVGHACSIPINETNKWNVRKHLTVKFDAE
jgi:hypothetical protein